MYYLRSILKGINNDAFFIFTLIIKPLINFNDIKMTWKHFYCSNSEYTEDYPF
jgi:hypothetical protein